MDELETLMKFWPLLAAGIGFVVWLVRLENMARNNAKALRDTTEQVDRRRIEDLEAAKQARDETHAMLREMRTDIKSLVEKVTVAVARHG